MPRAVVIIDRLKNLTDVNAGVQAKGDTLIWDSTALKYTKLAVGGNGSVMMADSAVAGIGVKFGALGTSAVKDYGLSVGNVVVIESDGHISPALLPSQAINNTYSVATQAAMLALAANRGDVAVRSDQSKSYILSATPATVLANWTELLSPSGGVSSVNTLTGAVTLTTSNIAEGTGLYYTTERAQDDAAAMIQNGTGISFVYNDAAGTLTPTVSLAAFSTTNLAEGTNLYYTTERMQDDLNATIANGTGISKSYDDVGNLLTINAAGVILRAPQILTSGTSYTAPSNCTKILIEVIAGGGGGGGSAGAASSVGAAGGGGSGGYASKWFVVTPSTVYTYAIGAAGAAGVAGNNAGGTGGNSTFAVGGVTVTALGGVGGAGSGAAAATALATAGGAGGAISTNGDLNGSGAPGGGGMRLSGTIGMSGAGAPSTFGGGGLGRIAHTAGAASVGFGGGGGGALSIGAGNLAGGAGAPGVIRVSEYS